ncbi:MAG: hypothetical protein COT74_07305 [Bdellovibrionales bacterium CG10_big_fil_rev_8_21_14_0_10_45_34]|nr:MAG: hypothetical protein COT74_07305 [Bdellovibrionales bacterium CG10_big_fil_rev_8_21_14_0_10_45_34]
MQKISGILPSNSRITNVDMAQEKLLRSGVPSFGQPVASPSARLSFSQKAFELGGNHSLLGNPLPTSERDKVGGIYSPGQFSKPATSISTGLLSAEIPTSASNESLNISAGEKTELVEARAADGPLEQMESQRGNDALQVSRESSNLTEYSPITEEVVL